MTSGTTTTGVAVTSSSSASTDPTPTSTGAPDPTTTVGTAADSTGSSSTTTGEAPIGPPVCDNPVPIEQPGGGDSGFVRCDNGVVHRVEAVECVTPPVPLRCAQAPGECTAHADCPGPLGHCDQSCSCVTTCNSGSDCASDEICACADYHHPRCIPALCHTDADCDGSICAAAIADHCDPVLARLGCHGPASECHTNADCPPQSEAFIVFVPICTPEPNFVCEQGGAQACP